jgi:hypothetical protein
MASSSDASRPAARPAGPGSAAPNRNLIIRLVCPAAPNRNFRAHPSAEPQAVGLTGRGARPNRKFAAHPTAEPQVPR